MPDPTRSEKTRLGQWQASGLDIHALSRYLRTTGNSKRGISCKGSEGHRGVIARHPDNAKRSVGGSLDSDG